MLLLAGGTRVAGSAGRSHSTAGRTSAVACDVTIDRLLPWVPTRLPVLPPCMHGSPKNDW